MPILHRKQTIHRPLSEVFAFFDRPENLQMLTPTYLNFEILTPSPITMNAGAVIDYRLSLFGIPFGWKTLISEYDPPHAFVDEQLQGPYSKWVHTHRFRKMADGATEIEDIVDYELPLGQLGTLANTLWVKAQLKGIFDYRRATIKQLFG